MTQSKGPGTDDKGSNAEGSKPPLSIDLQGRLTLIDANFSDTSHAELVARLQRVAQEKASSLDPRIEELRTRLSRFSPGHVVTQLTIARTSRPADEEKNTDPTFGDEARIEYIAGLALSLESPGTELAGPGDVGEIWDLASGVIEDAQALLYTNSIPADSDPEIAEAQFLLRMEHLLDRMHGYPQHLEKMGREVFDPLREKCKQELGFSPSDVVRIVHAMTTLARDRVISSFEEADELLAKNPPTDQQWADMEDRERRMQVFSWKLFRVGVDTLTFLPDDLADLCEIPAGEIQAALDAYGCIWGCQPTFRLPWETNVVRARPVIKVNGGYFVPLPWALLGEMTNGFLSLVRERALTNLEDRFLKSRDAATVALTASTLAALFGGGQVRTELQYESEGKQGDIDCLAEIDDVILTAECKAHRLNDEARRGLSASVKTKIKELVRKPMEQSARAAGYLQQGGRSFQTRGGTEIRLSPGDDAEIVRLVVSFERVDPFVANAAALGMAEAGAPWMICLADLMMVADLLPEPERFLDYARGRIWLSGHARFTAFTEADILGAYLVDGLREVRSALEQHPDREIVLGFHAGEINALYRQEIGDPAVQEA